MIDRSYLGRVRRITRVVDEHTARSTTLVDVVALPGQVGALALATWCGERAPRTGQLVRATYVPTKNSWMWRASPITRHTFATVPA